MSEALQSAELLGFGFVLKVKTLCSVVGRGE